MERAPRRAERGNCVSEQPERGGVERVGGVFGATGAREDGTGNRGTGGLTRHGHDQIGRRTQVWIAAEAGAARNLRRLVLGEWRIAPADKPALAYRRAGRDASEVEVRKLAGYREAAAAGADMTDPETAEQIGLSA